MTKSIFKKINIPLFILIFLLEIISLISIKSAEKLLPSYMQDLFWKQLIWYTIGYLFIIFVLHFKSQFLYKNIWFFYWLFNGLLFLLLLFGTPINDAKCWFTIPGIGSFQPSEFMKITLIIIEGTMIQKFFSDHQNPTWKQELLFLCKIGLVLLFPCFLTFLEPDTGVVLIYLLITFVMLFISGFHYRWFLIIILLIVFFLSILLGIYFLNQNLFLNLFGTSFFLRIDRLLDWSQKSGFQLENGMMSIGSGGLFGNGFLKTPIYFPEPQTDFIFAVYASNFGFIGSIFLIGLITYFDYSIIKVALNAKEMIHKYIISGILGMLIYQQVQNIGMTFGLMPITGITLPFISYGGSSLLSYMIMLGIVFSISSERYH